MSKPAEQYDDMAAWAQADAQRLNEMAERARKSGVTVDVQAGPPPDLNPDGSLAETE